MKGSGKTQVIGGELTSTMQWDLIFGAKQNIETTTTFNWTAPTVGTIFGTFSGNYQASLNANAALGYNGPVALGTTVGANARIQLNQKTNIVTVNITGVVDPDKNPLLPGWQLGAGDVNGSIVFEGTVGKTFSVFGLPLGVRSSFHVNQHGRMHVGGALIITPGQKQ